MAWDEKFANRTAKAPAPKLDRFDLEAAAEGGAARYFAHNDLKPQLGRRIAKNAAQLDGRRKTADANATRNLVADTAAAHKAHTVADPRKRHNLRAA